MTAVPAATAFLMPGYGEWIVILVVALLIFGRRLPEVGRTLGKTVTEFRRGLNSLKEDMHKDDDLREMRTVVHDFKRAVEAPRVHTDPRRLLDLATRDTDSDSDPVTDSATSATPADAAPSTTASAEPTLGNLAAAPPAPEPSLLEIEAARTVAATVPEPGTTAPSSPQGDAANTLVPPRLVAPPPPPPDELRS